MQKNEDQSKDGLRFKFEVIILAEEEETPQTKCIKQLEHLVEKWKEGKAQEYTFGPDPHLFIASWDVEEENDR